MSSDFPPPATEGQRWLVNFIVSLDDSSIPIIPFEDLLSQPTPIPTSTQQPSGDFLKVYEVAHEVLLDIEEDYRGALREAAELDVDLSSFEVPPMGLENGRGFEGRGMIEGLSREVIQSRILQTVRRVRWIREQIVRVDGELAGKMRQ